MAKGYDVNSMVSELKPLPAYIQQGKQKPDRAQALSGFSLIQMIFLIQLFPGFLIFQSQPDIIDAALCLQQFQKPGKQFSAFSASFGTSFGTSFSASFSPSFRTFIHTPFFQIGTHGSHLPGVVFITIDCFL